MHAPAPLEELRKSKKAIPNVNIWHREKLSEVERFALWITRHVGSMGFFFIVIGWTFGWLGWNMFAPVQWRFDPFPAFVLWLFISNVMQLFFLPLIMVGQNLESRHSEYRAEADFEVNTKAEREIEAIIQHLENQHEMMLDILRRTGKTPREF